MFLYLDHISEFNKISFFPKNMSDDKKFLRFKPVHDVLLPREVVAKQPDGKDSWDEVVANVNSAIDSQ